MFTSINSSLSCNVYLASIGVVYICIIAICVTTKFYRAVRIFLIPRLVPQKLDSYGKWAVITGGSSGIGKSFAHRLAKSGMDIVIISNEIQALRTTSNEIQSQHGVQCDYVCADFTEGPGVFEDVLKRIGEKDIGILVNGAGIIGTIPELFLKEKERNILMMVDLHITAVVYMTLKILPLMLAKKKGIIVNISSGASFRPLATWNVYSCTKAFTNFFTRALRCEYKNRNVNLQSLTPFFVSSRMTENMTGLPRFGGIVPGCDTFSASAVSTFGIENETTGYWIHEIMMFLLKLLPERIIEYYCLRQFIKNKDNHIP